MADRSPRGARPAGKIPSKFVRAARALVVGGCLCAVVGYGVNKYIFPMPKQHWDPIGDVVRKDANLLPLDQALADVSLTYTSFSRPYLAT